MLADNAARHPSLLSDDGIEAAKVIDGGEGKAHDFLVWVRRQFTGGVVAEYNEGALVPLAKLYADPKVKNFILDTIPKLFEKFKGGVSARMFQAWEVRQRLSTAISNYAKFSEKSVEGRWKVSDQHQEKSTGTIGALQTVNSRMRLSRAQQFIDDMSQELLDMGLDEATANAVKDNLGKYMHLSYENTYADNWAQVVKDTAAWDSAFEFLKGNYGVPYNDGGLTDGQIRGLMMWMLSRQKGGAINFAKGDIPKQYFRVIDDLGLGTARRPGPAATDLQDLTELKHLSDIPPGDPRAIRSQ